MSDYESIKLQVAKRIRFYVRGDLRNQPIPPDSVWLRKAKFLLEIPELQEAIGLWQAVRNCMNGVHNV